MELYHASGEIVEYPEVRKGKYTKDFSWGFYCTNNKEQAKKWALKHAENPTINIYIYTENSELKILKFEEMNDEWLDLKFKYPTHQISFHTLKALNCLHFERSEQIHE